MQRKIRQLEEHLGGLGAGNQRSVSEVLLHISMPLTFLCGTYLPLSLLPGALRVVANCNPMTYTTAFFRTVLLERSGLSAEQLVAEQLAFQFGSFTVTPAVSLVITLLFGALFLLLSSIVFTRVDFSRINRTRMSDSDIWA